SKGEPNAAIGSTIELSAVRSDGTVFPIELSLSVGEHGAERIILAVIRDITDRKEAEKRRQQASQERYDQVRRIAGGVAHDIHNALFPATSCLSKLSGRLDLRDTEDIERNRKLLELTDRSIERAVSMTELVKQYSKLESEKKIEDTLLLPILQEVVETHKSHIEQFGVRITIDVPADLSLRCYAPHIHSLFDNLLINALDALTEVDKKQIDIVAERKGGRLNINFSDNGSGIPEEHLPKVFDAFFTTKLSAGTGLGLAMVKKITELYEGDISVESSIDKGTKFVIFLY
ncbi:MAG: PAS domain-containing sensor histidine kinase, partial [candidate division Zixibacteria bacterium]|nr:PAS domain-containing sensor histidine kinase [candidate division Zixibacteria bacterium]